MFRICIACTTERVRLALMASICVGLSPVSTVRVQVLQQVQMPQQEWQQEYDSDLVSCVTAPDDVPALRPMRTVPALASWETAPMYRLTVPDAPAVTLTEKLTNSEFCDIGVAFEHLAVRCPHSEARVMHHSPDW